MKQQLKQRVKGLLGHGRRGRGSLKAGPEVQTSSHVRGQLEFVVAQTSTRPQGEVKLQFRPHLQE